MPNTNVVQLREAITRYYEPVKRRFGYLLKDHHLAEDLAQEVFARFCKTVDSGREIENTEKFIKAIVQNVFYEYLRQKKRRHDELVRDDNRESSNSTTPDKSTELEDTKRILWDLLKQFDPQDQWIIIGRYFFDMKGQELADSVGIPRRTLIDRHNRIIKKLRYMAINRGLQL